MASRKQLTVYLENKPGRLAQVLSALAQAKINIIALAVMDRQDKGVLRLVTEDEVATKKALSDLNLQSTVNDVLVVELRNQPGALAHVCETLAGGHINIDYAYCSSGGRNGKVHGIFKVSNLEKAERVLAAAGNHSNRRIQIRPLRDQRTYKKQ
ncbi:MAG: ACT domain-containing protein [Gemmataceae bacterium]|nr:ACT domain-containing protein [Gemmataceae bacterium]